jgi:hypothetical protein
MAEIKFEIIKKVGVLSKSEKGCPLRGGALMAPRFWDLRTLPMQSATRYYASPNTTSANGFSPTLNGCPLAGIFALRPCGELREMVRR